MKDQRTDSTGLKLKFFTTDNTVSIGGECLPLLSINSDHPLLTGLTKKQTFELAYRLGGEARSYQYRTMLLHSTNNQITESRSGTLENDSL